MEKFATKVFPRLVNNGESRPRSVLTTLFSPEIARLLKLNEFQYVPRAARRTFRAVHYIVCTFGDAGARRYLQRRRPDSKTLNGSFGEEFSPFRPPPPYIPRDACPRLDSPSAIPRFGARTTAAAAGSFSPPRVVVGSRSQRTVKQKKN